MEEVVEGGSEGVLVPVVEVDLGVVDIVTVKWGEGALFVCRCELCCWEVLL